MGKNVQKIVGCFFGSLRWLAPSSAPDDYGDARPQLYVNRAGQVRDGSRDVPRRRHVKPPLRVALDYNGHSRRSEKFVHQQRQTLPRNVHDQPAGYAEGLVQSDDVRVSVVVGVHPADAPRISPDPTPLRTP